jgi:hypothetical protein
VFDVAAGDERGGAAGQAAVAAPGPRRAGHFRGRRAAARQAVRARASTNLDLLVVQRRPDDATPHYLQGSLDPEFGARCPCETIGEPASSADVLMATVSLPRDGGSSCDGL